MGVQTVPGQTIAADIVISDFMAMDLFRPMIPCLAAQWPPHAKTALSADRRDLDDIAAVLLDHVGQHKPATQVGSLQLGVDDCVPGLFIHFRNGHHGGVAGIVDQNIYLAEGFDNLGHHGFDIGGLAHVALDADRLAAHGLNAFHGLIHRSHGGHVIRDGIHVFTDVGNGDVRAFFSQAAGNRQSIASGAASHDGYLTF
jgi:hypothetical protein